MTNKLKRLIQQHSILTSISVRFRRHSLSPHRCRLITNINICRITISRPSRSSPVASCAEMNNWILHDVKQCTGRWKWRTCNCITPKWRTKWKGVKPTVQKWSWLALALRPPQVQLFNSVWCPFKQEDIKELEKIKRSNQTYYRVKQHHENTLWGKRTVFTRSAITPPKVSRFGWNLEQCEPNVGSWPQQILGAIGAVATVWEAAEMLFFSF